MKLSKAHKTDYMQLAFKLQGDIENIKWEQANKDLPFLKEIRGYIILFRDTKDVSYLEMAYVMLSDWIDELQKIFDNEK